MTCHPKVPFVMGELGHFFTPDSAHLPTGTHVELVRSQLTAAVEQTADCALVSAEGLTDLGDKLHFDTESLYEFGRRYAETWAAVDLAGSWRFGVSPVAPVAAASRSLAAVSTDRAAAVAWQECARAELARLLLGSDSHELHDGAADVLTEEVY